MYFIQSDLKDYVMNDIIHTIMFTTAFENGSFADLLASMKDCGVDTNLSNDELRVVYNNYVKDLDSY
jgi:hypothetical protein